MNFPRRSVIALTILGVCAGCAVDGLAFVQDDRVRIVEPAESADVVLPLRVEWTAAGVDGSFAVFFDRSPMRPGQSLRSLVPANDTCLLEPACPDENWLADHGVYVTTEPALVVEDIPDRRTTSRGADRHDLTIVYLDDAGRRVGESAFYREFFVERDR